MKGNNGSGNNPLRDEWVTPSWIFKPLDKQYTFDYDCAATQQNTKCKLFSSRRLAFDLSINLDKTCWMNPPFSIAWKMFEHFFKEVSKGIAIYRCDNFETGIWQKVIFPNATWIFIPDRRVCYDGLDGDGARFPSALIGFNVDPPRGLNGITLKPSPFHGVDKDKKQKG